MKSKSKLSATKQNKIIFPSNPHKNINTVLLSTIVILSVTVIRLPVATQNPHTNFTFFGSSLNVPPLYNTSKNIFNDNKIYFKSTNTIPGFLEREVVEAFKRLGVHFANRRDGVDILCMWRDAHTIYSALACGWVPFPQGTSPSKDKHTSIDLWQEVLFH